MKRIIILLLVALFISFMLSSFGCREQIEFEISMVSRRAVTLEDAELASDVGQQLRFGYLSKDNHKNYVGGWRIFPGETLTVTWIEKSKPQSSQITVASTNVGPKGIEIEIKADGTLTAGPK